jgi:hypothetical protein
MMGDDEIKKVSAFKIELEDVDDGREAVVLIVSGLMFFFKNYPVKTVFVFVLISLLIWQSVTNFEMIKAASSAIVGLGG